MNRYELQVMNGDAWETITSASSFNFLRDWAIKYTNGVPRENLVIYDTEADHSWPVYEKVQVTVEQEEIVPEALMRDALSSVIFRNVLLISAGILFMFHITISALVFAITLILSQLIAYLASQFASHEFLYKRYYKEKRKNDKRGSSR